MYDENENDDPINIFVENDKYFAFHDTINWDKVKTWLIKVAEDEGFSIDKVNIILCDDDYLLKINQSFLNHDYYTDIITFPYSTGHSIESDIFISLERVFENAKEFNVNWEMELMRIIVHGLLHLVGYQDKLEGEKEIMRNKENEALNLL